MKDIKIGKYLVGENHPPFIIAELSGNHNQSLERALDLVDAAAKAGAHAVKLQTYTAETMTIKIDDPLFKIQDPNSLWDGKELYDLYEEAHTPWEWHEEIFKRCEEKGVICLSTPFDATAVDFLEKFNPPVYKVASFENTDIPLLKKIASTGKPIIVSTGIASLSDLETTVATLRESGCNDIILLKCTSSYPSSPENTNIRTIPHLKNLFDTQVGLSDHTLGIGAAVASIALGARVVEKHFTLARKDGGVDSAFSMEPHELKNLVDDSLRAFQSLGEVSYGIHDVEEGNKIFKRSIFVVEDIKAGEVLTEKNTRCIRPGYGLKPKHFEEVIGKTASKDIPRGTPLSFDLLS